MHPDHKKSMMNDLSSQQYPCYPSNERFSHNIHEMPYQNLSPMDYPIPANKRMRKLPKRTNYDFSDIPDQNTSNLPYQENSYLPRI